MKWKEIRDAITELLQTANPEAIADCDLSLALLRREDRESRSLVDSYRNSYAPVISARIQPLERTIGQIESEVERLLTIARLKLASSKEKRSNILDLCKRLADELYGLKDLADLGKAND